MPVDLRANELEAGFLRRALRSRGLPENFKDAIAFLARQIRDHDHLAQMLTSMEADDRVDFLESVRPHLKFAAKPLDSYISAMGQRAEREQWPTQDAEGKLHAFQPARDISSTVQDAENAIARNLARRTLTVKCVKCTAQETFYMIGKETAVDVRRKALTAGWVLHPQEICPICPTSSRPNA